jgi:hypothetical protein
VGGPITTTAPFPIRFVLLIFEFDQNVRGDCSKLPVRSGSLQPFWDRWNPVWVLQKGHLKKRERIVFEPKV